MMKRSRGSVDPADSGHRVYTTAFLRLYDTLVLGLYARWVWRVPSRLMVERYQRHVVPGHLDVGPGTGWFIERAGLPLGAEVTLVDANADVLAYASKRVRKAGLIATTVRADVTRPLPLQRRYPSVGCSFLLHCLPGPPARKTTALRHLSDVLEPEGVLFGSTILSDPEQHTAVSRTLLRALNRKGIFSNRDDTSDAIRAALTAVFEDVTFEVVGAGVIFTGRHPRHTLEADLDEGGGRGASPTRPLR